MKILNKSTVEQQLVIDAIKTKNVLVNACAGSGKTTSILNIAKTYPHKKIIVLTFNKRLQSESTQDAHELGLTNINFYTYHGFTGMITKSLCKDSKDMNDSIQYREFNNQYEDILIIDEMQDITDLSYKMIIKYLQTKKEKDKKSNLLILGDSNQDVYSSLQSITELFKFAPDILKDYNNLEWFVTEYTQTFRCTKPIANFVNHLTKSKRLVSNKEGLPVRYIIDSSYQTHREVLKYLEMVDSEGNLLYKPSDIFILAPSVKKNQTNGKRLPPALQIENALNEHNCRTHIQFEGETLSEEHIKESLIISSYHMSKGLERKIVFVLGFDDAYYTMFKSDRHLISSPQYVALTRAKEQLVIIQEKPTKASIIKEFGKTIITSKNIPVKSLDWKYIINNKDIQFEYDETLNIPDNIEWLSLQSSDRESTSVKTADTLIKWLPFELEIEFNNKVKNTKTSFGNKVKISNDSNKIIDKIAMQLYATYKSSKGLKNILTNLQTFADKDSIKEKSIGLYINHFIEELIDKISNNTKLEWSEITRLALYVFTMETLSFSKIYKHTTYDWISEKESDTIRQNIDNMLELSNDSVAQERLTTIRKMQYGSYEEEIKIITDIDLYDNINEDYYMVVNGEPSTIDYIKSLINSISIIWNGLKVKNTYILDPINNDKYRIEFDDFEKFLSKVTMAIGNRELSNYTLDNILDKYNFKTIDIYEQDNNFEKYTQITKTLEVKKEVVKTVEFDDLFDSL